jgi:hypothetical protein
LCFPLSVSILVFAIEIISGLLSILD